MELCHHSNTPIMFSLLSLLSILLTPSSGGASPQIMGETADQQYYGQIFSRVDSDLNGNLFRDFVDFNGGDFLEYDDLMTSESALTEQQLTDRQTKLRELYRGRRPIGGDKVNPRVSFFNRLKGGKKKNTKEEEKRDPIKEKILDKIQSGMAVTVVKPPPDYQIPQSAEKNKEKPTEAVIDKKKKKTNPLKDWRGKQKQREAVATSLIGSRLKDLKEKRKKLMNSNLVTEHTAKPSPKKTVEVERIDKDFESFDEAANSGAQLVKVEIEEKSSESFKFPSKKRRFKPQIKSAAAPPKWSIKENFKNKHKHEVATKTKVETTNKSTEDIVKMKNKTDNKKGKDRIVTQSTPESKEKKKIGLDVAVENKENIVSEEILDEVYAKAGQLEQKVSKLKETVDQKKMEKKEKKEENEKTEQKEKEKEAKPDWLNSPRKKSRPLKHIDAEESALPLSIIPHGVPLKRGFSQTERPAQVLVLPTSSSSSSSDTSRPASPVKPAFSQFLTFGPLQPTSSIAPSTSTSSFPTPSTTSSPSEVVRLGGLSESFHDKLATLKKKTETPAVQGFSEEETAELLAEEAESRAEADDEEKMTADLINSKIESVLDIKMPNYTRLLYGEKDGQRFERNSNSSSDEGKPYSFNYSILDEETGVTHSRDESSDEKGVIRGSYEVLEISRRPCNQTAPAENSQQEVEEEEKAMEKEVEVVMEEREGKEANLEEKEEKKAEPEKREEAETNSEKKDATEATVAETSETPETQETSEVGVEGRAANESDLELIEAEESREVVSGQSRGDNAEDRLFIDIGSLLKKPPPLPRIPVASKPPSSGPDIQYGGFKPATVSAGESYGAPQAPPASQAPDSYGSPVGRPVSGPGNPLPSNGVKVDSPVENFISQVDPEAKSVVDDNNYDPFVFQAVGQAGQASDDAKTGNLQLGNFNNHNNNNNNNHNNNNRGHNTDTFAAPEFTSTSLNEPLVFESNNNDNIFNPFGVSVATAHDPTQRPNNFPASTERPNSIVVTPFGQQKLPDNPPRPAGTPPSRPQEFFPSTSPPQRPSTTRRPTRRTTRRTTTRSVILQQNSPVTNTLDEGLRDPADFAVLDFGSPTLQPFQRPGKLTIGGDRPKVNELNGNSGIFFSTPSTSFVTPPDFATPGPTRAPAQFQQLNLQQGPFSVDQVITTTASPFPPPPTTLRGRGEAVTGTPRPVFSPVNVTPQTNFFHIGNSQNNLFENVTPRPANNRVTPQSSLINNVTPQSNFANSVTPQFPSSFASTAAPPAPSSPALFTNNVPPAAPGRPATRRPARPAQSARPTLPTLQSLTLGNTQRPSRPSNFNSFVLGSPAVSGNKRKSSTDRLSNQVKDTESESEALRRNMLMNIILRPGGGDRAKALPRPKVEVNSEGANVIVVRLTFPDNENIQGLRAFTPTQPEDLEKFAELRKAISSEDASVERLTAISSEEENFLSDEEVRAQVREKKLGQQVVQHPTRPPRPSKNKKPVVGYLPPPPPPNPPPPPAKKPSSSYLPPVGAPLTKKKKNQGFSFQLPARSPKHFSGGERKGSGEVINMIDNKEAGFFKFREVSSESEEGGVSRIKPRQPQDEPPPPQLPSSFEKGSKELVPFRPSEAFTEHKQFHSRPVRPPRPPKPIQVVNNFPHPPRPKGPPPLQKLPLRGVQLTKTGRKHPGIVFQSRKDAAPRSYYPLLQQAWRGLLL